MTMHILPVYYTTTNTRKRKKKNKTKSLIVAEREHEKFLKRMGLNSHSSTNKAPKRSVAQFGSASALGAEGQRFKSSHSDQFLLPLLRLILWFASLNAVGPKKPACFIMDKDANRTCRLSRRQRFNVRLLSCHQRAVPPVGNAH